MSSIAFFILLLATFSYSAPIGQEYGNSTPDYELTTDRQKPINMRSFVDDQSTNTPVIRDDRSSESIEVTTEDVTHSPRSFEDSTMIDRKIERNIDEDFSTPQMNDKRILEDSTPLSSSESIEEFSTTSSMQIKQKRIFEDSTKPVSSESTEEFSTTPSMQIKQKRVNQDSIKSSSSESTEKDSTTPFIPIKQKRIFEDSTKPLSSESSEERNRETSTDMNQKRDVLEGVRVQNDKRTVDKFMYTTMESRTGFNQHGIRLVESEEVESTTMVESTNPVKKDFLELSKEFNERAIRPVESEEVKSSTMVEPTKHVKKDCVESSKEFNQRAIRPVEFEKVESSTMVETTNPVKKSVEPSSSVQSFGKYTGLLADAQNSTPDYEITTESGKQPERLTKTVSIIPGKITETKTSVVNQPVEREQLSQVQDQPVVEKKESNH